MKQTSFQQYLSDNYRKVIGWGTSKFFEDYAPELNVDLAYLIDSDPSKWGNTRNGLSICSPNALQSENPDETLIIVFSSFYNEICTAIQEIGPFYTIRADQINDLLFHKEELLTDRERESGVVLTISRNNFATRLNGTAKLIREQMDIFNRLGKTHIHLYWGTYQIKKFEGTFVTVIKNGLQIGVYPLADIFNILRYVKICIIHNLTGMNPEIAAQIAERLPEQINIFYYIHDFSCICSHIKLMYNDEFFCQAFDRGWAPCKTCQFGPKRETIHAFHEIFFQNDRIQLLAPSENTKSIVCKSFSLSPNRITVIPHQTYTVSLSRERRKNDKLKVAYVGYRHKHKGWEEFKRLYNQFNKEYEFYCFGENDDILNGINHVPVSFIEDGEHAMVRKLTEHGIDIAFLWSTWPETYSYTYFESFAAGCFVITNHLSGNIADQVIANKNGVVLQNEEDLMELMQDRDRLKRLVERNRLVIHDLSRNESAFMKIIASRS